MDRRTFARTLPLAALGAAACASDNSPLSPREPREPVEPPQNYTDPGDRAMDIARGLVRLAQAGPSGPRWQSAASGTVGYPNDFYAGQAGIVAFLAEAHRYREDTDVRNTALAAAQALQAVSSAGARGLYDGNSGRAWAWLAVHRAFGGEQWLQAARNVAQTVASGTTGLPGDIINGPPGQAMILLRMHEVTGEEQWLTHARRIADTMLRTAVRSEGGIKIPSFTDQATGLPVCYTGFSHGSAGAGWFLCRLAAALPQSERAQYLDAAESIAVWLNALSYQVNDIIAWYRREPDQMNQRQYTWCHGPPGIGLFYVELYRLTGNASYLDTAARCGDATLAMTNPLQGAGICHGTAGNAALFLELYEETKAQKWIGGARTFGDYAWNRRSYNGQSPIWAPAGPVDHSAMLGSAGIGWYLLQLATDNKVKGPATPYLA